jgi:hypothetical protein
MQACMRVYIFASMVVFDQMFFCENFRRQSKLGLAKKAVEHAISKNLYFTEKRKQIDIFELFGSKFVNTKTSWSQGCQMVYFRTKNYTLGKLWSSIECKMFVYFMTIWNILLPFGLIYGRLIVCGHLVHFSQIGMSGPKKSGNPAWSQRSKSLRHNKQVHLDKKYDVGI